MNESRVDRNMSALTIPPSMLDRWLAVRLEFLGSIIILGAAGLSILTLKSGHLSAGLVGLSVSYALQVTQSLNWIVRMTVEVETNIVSVERILAIFSIDTRGTRSYCIIDRIKVGLNLGKFHLIIIQQNIDLN